MKRKWDKPFCLCVVILIMIVCYLEVKVIQLENRIELQPPKKSTKEVCWWEDKVIKCFRN